MKSKEQLFWYHYFYGFLSGFFILNTIPHLIHGINGDSFPTPFASPPFYGLSSSFVNTLWALLNLALSYVFFKAGKVTTQNKASMLLFFLGFATLAVAMSLLAPSMLHK